MTDPTQWEYRSIMLGTSWSPMKDEEMEDILNEWGEDGWEVLAVVPVPNGMKVRIIAKRKLDLRVRRRRSMPSVEK